MPILDIEKAGDEFILPILGKKYLSRLKCFKKLDAHRLVHQSGVAALCQIQESRWGEAISACLKHGA